MADMAVEIDDVEGGSYLGLIAVLIVILTFLALLVSAGIAPLKKTHEAVIEAPTNIASLPGQGGSGARFASMPDASAVLTRIAFGAGVDARARIAILDSVAEMKPQLFVLAGRAGGVSAEGAPGSAAEGRLLAASSFAGLAANGDLRRFRAAIPILGVWDRNLSPSASAPATLKSASKEAFLQFYGLESDRDFAEHEGAYNSAIFGEAPRRAQIILLDTASFAAPDSILGAAQWAWLEQQLIADADVRLIVSSEPVLSADAASPWAANSHERERLIALLKRYDVKGVVFLSGGPGPSAIFKDEKSLSYPLVEISSARLNTQAATSAANATANVKPVTAENFGVVDFDWNARALNLELRDAKGALIYGQSVPLPPIEG